MKQLIRRGLPTTGRPCWERPGTHLFFHYTQAGLADAIFDEQRFLVPDRPGAQGCGLYVTNIKPGSRSDEFILNTLFAHGRDKLAIEGVVVLSKDAIPFEHVGPHSFFHSAPAGTTIDLGAVLIGSGRRDRDTWRWTAGIFA